MRGLLRLPSHNLLMASTDHPTSHRLPNSDPFNTFKRIQEAPTSHHPLSDTRDSLDYLGYTIPVLRRSQLDISHRFITARHHLTDSTVNMSATMNAVVITKF